MASPGERRSNIHSHLALFLAELAAADLDEGCEREPVEPANRQLFCKLVKTKTISQKTLKLSTEQSLEIIFTDTSHCYRTSSIFGKYMSLWYKLYEDTAGSLLVYFSNRDWKQGETASLVQKQSGAQPHMKP